MREQLLQEHLYDDSNAEIADAASIDEQSSEYSDDTLTRSFLNQSIETRSSYSSQNDRSHISSVYSYQSVTSGYQSGTVKNAIKVNLPQKMVSWVSLYLRFICVSFRVSDTFLST